MNWAQVYKRQVEQLQHALDHPEIRDEAVQILRGLIERVSIRPAKSGLEIEFVGEIAKMVELGVGPNAKQANLGERLTRSVKVVAGALQPPRIDSAADPCLTARKSTLSQIADLPPR